MKTLRTYGLTALLSVLAAGLHASQIRVPVDSATSTMNLQLCANPGGLGTDCDNDTKPLGGFLTVGLDNNGNPSQISLRDFDLQGIGTFDLNLSWLLGLARVDATATSLRIYHSRPGIANPPVPVTGGAFTLLNIPIRTSGNANYVINPTACGFVTFPCSSNIDLATFGESNIETLSGTLGVANGILTVNLDLTFSAPLDDTNPDLGTFTGHAIVHGSAPVSLSLVPRGSDWKYLDDGSDQSTSYVLPPPLYDDIAWPLGVAQLGYGDGDEATVVSYGPNAANKRITTYFRHSFQIPDADIYTNASLRVLHDDGVIVYLNGGEIYRANMPLDLFPGFLALATTSINGLAENVFFVGPPVGPYYLQTGLNVLAVEIHQNSAGSSDISFDLELIGNGIFTNSPPSIAITSPTNNAGLLGTAVAIAATASDLDGFVTLVEFFEGANKIGETAATGPNYAFNWTNACPGTFALTARATDNDGLVVVSAPVVITITRPPLITPGATWKYLDNGTIPTADWRSNTFNDGAWLSGAAQLGFADGDETTTLARTNANGSTNITFYFRRAFAASNITAGSTVNLRVLRDDGIIVYVNGAEAFRNNMPAGAPLSTTLAVTNATPFEESNFTFTVSISPALLINGNNLIAAEVHQQSIGSSDLSFALALDDISTNRPPNLVALTTPTNNSSFPLQANITLQATASDADGTVRRVEYYAGTNKLGQATSPPYTFVWNNAPAGAHLVTAHAVDECGAVGLSAAALVRVGAFTIVPAGANWRYRDTGSDQGTAWRAINFASHFTWAAGNAQFGYGENDESTVLARTNTSGTTNITFYFRHLFTVPDPNLITGLVVRLLRDDGAVGYINGLEIFRSNMPAGAVDYLTLAPLAVGGVDETTFFLDSFENDVLVAGTNVLAVEIHQQAINSSDVSFDLELLGLVGEVHPRLFITPTGNSHLLQWPSAAAGFRLQFSTDLRSPANWQNHPGTPADDGAWKSLLLPNIPPGRFYRLSQ